MRMHSGRLEAVEYSIREIEDFARNYAAKHGVKLRYLNIGDPVKLGMGALPSVINSAIKSLRDGNNFYAKSDGADVAREAIAQFYDRRGMSVRAQDAYITSGVTEAISMLYLSIFNRGERIALPKPYYPLYDALARLYGIKPVFYNFDEHGFPDINSVKDAVKRRAKAVVVINPNNPLGSSMPKSLLDEIKEYVLSSSATLISDEIYSEMVYDRGMSYALRNNEDDKVIVLSGISKLFRVPGWRIGWAVFGRHRSLKGVVDNFRKLMMLRLCSPTPFQHALPHILSSLTDAYLRNYMGLLKRNAKIVYRKINDSSVLSVNQIHAAYYAFIKMGWRQKSINFVKDLIKRRGIVVVPGVGFGMEGHFRIVFAGNRRIVSENIDEIVDEALKHSH